MYTNYFYISYTQKKGINKKLIIERNYDNFQEQEQTKTRKEQRNS